MSTLNKITTGDQAIDDLLPRIRSFLEKDTMDMVIDGNSIRGYRSPDTPSVWLRDHSDMMRGFRYFEDDVTSAVTHFAETQARNGRIFDYFTVQPEKVPCERENWTKYVRVPVEADVEYRFIKASFLAWQSSGDDHWIKSMLPPMEKALEYIFSHPWRWDQEKQLVKRPYTIDSWDFAYTAGQHDWLQFQIDDNTFWGIMHGDNSGYYEACLHLATIYGHLGDNPSADKWKSFAKGLKERMNKVCWNGTFYTHFVKSTPVDIPGVDESAQLSFSNAMNINRGVTSHQQALSILSEYLRRGQSAGCFAEWFSIDPAFPAGIFGDDKIVPGAYCNGGIMPLVGGELARAYFNHGFESQGVETLKRYHQLISKNNETYLWYFPDGTESTVDTSTSPDAMPTDGWGSSSMLYGFIEGLAGIVDHGKQFQNITLSPRWHAADIQEADVSVGYETSGAGIRYFYREYNDRIELNVEARNRGIEADTRILLPQGAKVDDVVANGQQVPFSTIHLRESSYVTFQTTAQPNAEITLKFK